MGEARADAPAFATCRLYGMSLAQLDSTGVLDHVFQALARGQGGWLVTANLDFLRRYVHDVGSRTLYDAADIRVADGMPLVWAARLQGDVLPERVAGSSLVALLAERAAREGRSLYLLGGAPGASPRAAEVLLQRHPTLKIVGTSSPRVSDPPTAAEVEPMREELARLRPDLVLVGLGSPKQEKLIAELRPALPSSWLMGVGVSFSFLAGDVRRAPVWMQRTGLEWIHRLAQEPRRLARRYLVEDLPFSVSLFAHALRRRGSPP
jgi:N-acetylglucosaminyldiphosphoundecaprenol N-acetyl-beta-D-mannosaminyltransferase